MENVQIRVANAPCSWGILEFDEDQAGSGPALDCDRVLDEIASTGYVGTELGDWGFMPTDAAALRSELQARSLELVAAFVPVALAHREAHAAGIETAVRTAKLLAETAESPFIVLADENGSDPIRTRHAGRIEAGHAMTTSQWDNFCDGANALARSVFAETGVRTVFHHHAAGFVETPAEVERLLNSTDPEVLGLCLDTGHYAYGGGNPVEALARYGDRIWHVHFKDCHGPIARQARTEGWDYFRAVGAGVFCELGAGEVNFGAVLEALHQRDYRGWIVVEQDVLPGMGAPKDSAERNRKFLENLGV
jgi:inosose dehydratase